MKTRAQSTAKNLIDQITADQLNGIIAENKIVLIDVRSPEAIASHGAIPGAHNLPFDIVDEALQHWKEDPNSVFNSKKPYLFCCTGGVMSYAAAIKAQKNGLRHVYNLEGGHAAWLELKKVQAT